MYVAHSNISQTQVVKPKKVSAQEERVNLWMARQRQRNHEAACKKYDTEIKAIQKHIPGWMPDKVQSK